MTRQALHENNTLSKHDLLTRIGSGAGGLTGVKKMN